jgi:hypothetical protein
MTTSVIITFSMASGTRRRHTCRNITTCRGLLSRYLNGTERVRTCATQPAWQPIMRPPRDHFGSTQRNWRVGNDDDTVKPRYNVLLYNFILRYGVDIF